MRSRRLLALAIAVAAVPTAAAARPGTLDPTFGKGGMVIAGTTGPGSQGGALAVAVQSDGKIIVGGALNGSGSAATQVRYLPNGVPDPTYGPGGERPMAIAGTFPLFMHMLPGDVLLVAATLESSGALARHLSDGSLDPSFGTGGIVAVPSFRDVAVQADGKILLAAPELGVLRLRADGSVDTDFGTDGVAVGPEPHPTLVAPQGDGAIVAGTQTGGGPGVPLVFVLTGFDADGNVDPTFGTDGVLVFDPVPDARDTAVHLLGQAHGVVVVGQSIDTEYWFTLTQVLHGAINPFFGVLGVTRVNFRHQGAGFDEWPYAATLDGDGNVVIAGRAETDGIAPIALMRFEPNGTLDASMGTGGGALAYAPHDVGTYGIAVAPDGALVTAGSHSEVNAYGASHAIVAKFEGGGADLPRCPHTRDFTCRDLPPGSGKARLLVKNGQYAPQRGALHFQWSGAGTADLGDPLTADAFALCLYKDSEELWPPLRYAAAAPAGGTCGGKPCWKGGGGAFRYASAAGTPMGITAMKLKATAGSIKLAVKGRGPHLGGAMLPPVGGVVGSPFTLPIVVQLRSGNGSCWSVEFDGPPRRNDLTVLKLHEPR